MTMARVAIVVSLVTSTALAQTASARGTDYRLSFPNAVHHEAEIDATFRDVPPGPLDIRMARSSPGRYAIHEFAKNVYSVSATDGGGRALPIRRLDPYGWTVEHHDGTVRFHYTLFADRGDGTYSQINPAHAHLNIPATLAFAPALAQSPVTVAITPPDPNWTAATQLIPDGAWRWRARDLQYLMDSPIEIAALRERRWAASEPGSNYVVRLMIHSSDKDSDVDRFAAMAEKIYRTEAAMWGDIPDYDGGTYTFIADFVPYSSGDGMEHRNSTYLVSERSLADGKFGQIKTLAHELFHSWNVERLRPAELEPFDFTRANPAPTLWFAEGFTQYYGLLLARRAGVTSIDSFLKDLGSTLSYVETWTGRRYGSPSEMSLRAPFVDAATSIDPAYGAIFTSYYPYGATVALALDLQLRGRGNVSLDDMMRRLWRSNGVTEKPYTTDDLRNALAATSGDQALADQFFNSSIMGSSLPDYAPLLASAGLSIRPANPDKAYVGRASIAVADGKAVIKGYPEPGSALYAAGIGSGDRILTIAGKPVSSDAVWQSALKAMKPGRPVTVTLESLGTKRTAIVTPLADPAIKIVRDETLGKTPGPQQLAFRTAWLGPEGSMMPIEKKAKKK